MTQLNRASIGFDSMFDRLASTTFAKADNYPPHDIVKHGDFSYSIRVAVAGFKEDELSVSLENNALTITGTQENRTEKVEYLHHGISCKSFTKVLSLADHVVVKSAVYENGLLVIGLEISIPEELKPRQIPIMKAVTEIK
jgi:molecular chaperone IbpA